MSSRRKSPKFSFCLEVGCEEGGLNSPAKRPRLGSDRGFGKYGNEKVVQAGDSSRLRKKARSDVVWQNLTSPGDVPVGEENFRVPAQAADSQFGSQPSISVRESPTTNTYLESNCKLSVGGGCVEVLKEVDVFKKIEDGKGLLGHATTRDRFWASTLGNGSNEDDASIDIEALRTAVAAVQKQSEKEGTMPVSEVITPQFTSHDPLVTPAFSFGGTNWSKGMILNQLEKIEFEIDLIEKEQAKLEDEIHRGDFISCGFCPRIGEAQQPVELLLCTLPTVFEQHGNYVDKAPSVSYFLSPGGEGSRSTEGLTSPRVAGEVGRLTAAESAYQADIQDRKITTFDSEGRMKSLRENSEGGFPNSNLSVFWKATMGLISWDIKTYEMGLSLLLENRKIANQSLEGLKHLLPSSLLSSGNKLYSSPEEVAVWHFNLESYEKLKEHLEAKIAEAKRFLKFKEQVLVLKYRAQRETWKQDQLSFNQHKDRVMTLRQWESEYQKGILPSCQRSSLRLRPIAPGFAKSETGIEEIQVLTRLLNEPFDDQQRSHLRMPAMMLDEKERNFHRFVTGNGLVEDPVALEKERKCINPWTEEEKKIYLEMFHSFGKHFSKIALFLEHKTTADCVEFFYRNHKSEEFKKVRWGKQLKKHRNFSYGSSYLATTNSVTNWHREANAAHVDGLTLVAAAAAAAAAAAGTATRGVTKVIGNSAGKEADGNLVTLTKAGTLDSFSRAVVDFGNDKDYANIISGNTGTSAYIPNSITASGTNTKPFHGRLSSKRGSFPSSPAMKSGSVSEDLAGTEGARSAYSCSMESGEEVDSRWTDYERELFSSAIAMFGKDFHSIALHVGTKSQVQCETFFGKTRKRLGLDQLVEHFQASLSAGVETGVFDPSRCNH